MRLIDKLFRLEEINGGERCPTYLYRWTFLSTNWLGIYLHHFVGDDWSKDMHDHPKRFVSIGIWGSYIEETPGQEQNGQWETATDADGTMIRVRWSVAGDGGEHLYVRHYPADGWGKFACERDAQEMNKRGRSPYEWSCYRPPSIKPVERIFRSPWIRTFPANHIHRIRLIDNQPAWTLVFVFKAVRAWGFWHCGSWIPWRKYVDGPEASAMKNCP